MSNTGWGTVLLAAVIVGVVGFGIRLLPNGGLRDLVSNALNTLTFLFLAVVVIGALWLVYRFLSASPAVRERNHRAKKLIRLYHRGEINRSEMDELNALFDAGVVECNPSPRWIPWCMSDERMRLRLAGASIDELLAGDTKTS